MKHIIISLLLILLLPFVVGQSAPSLSVVSVSGGVNVSVVCPVGSWCQVRRVLPDPDVLL